MYSKYGEIKINVENKSIRELARAARLLHEIEKRRRKKTMEEPHEVTDSRPTVKTDPFSWIIYFYALGAILYIYYLVYRIAIHPITGWVVFITLSIVALCLIFLIIVGIAALIWEFISWIRGK